MNAFETATGAPSTLDVLITLEGTKRGPFIAMQTIETAGKPQRTMSRTGRARKRKRNENGWGGRGRTAVLLVGSVGAVALVVALFARADAALAVGAAELVERAARHVRAEAAVLLVGPVAAVDEPVALLLRLQADAARALEVLALARPVAWKAGTRLGTLETRSKDESTDRNPLRRSRRRSPAPCRIAGTRAGSTSC